MANRREQAALLLALRGSERGWADVTNAVEEAGSALSVLETLLTPDQPTLDHVVPDVSDQLDLAEKEIESWESEGIHLVTVLDEQYPVQLLMVHQRPPFLTCKGFLDPADQFGIAVVGSRNATARGLHITREIATTKNGERVEMRKQFTDELAYVLATFLVRHRGRLGEFDVVTVVPSTKQRRTVHPLIDVLARRLTITRYRFVEALTTSSSNNRQHRPDEYTVQVAVSGQRVLLIDDQWTSGASLQSSAIALKRTGAARVVGLVIGRRLDAQPSGSFDWNACVICSQR